MVVCVVVGDSSCWGSCLDASITLATSASSSWSSSVAGSLALSASRIAEEYTAGDDTALDIFNNSGEGGGEGVFGSGMLAGLGDLMGSIGGTEPDEDESLDVKSGGRGIGVEEGRRAGLYPLKNATT